MANDKYNGSYTDQAYVKGVWYGFAGGPKPQVYTGNIDNDTDLEGIRNRAIIIDSPSSSNGTFPPGGFGHRSAILTTRFGDDVYLQKLFDISDNVEWERVKVGTNQWSGWKRVTSYGDVSDQATTAYANSIDNKNAINDIYSKIGGRTNTRSNVSSSIPISDRVKSNSDAINSHTTAINGINTSITSLYTGSANDTVARNFMINQDVRPGQNPGIRFFSNTNEYTVNNVDSIQVIAPNVCASWGVTETNSVFFAANGNAGPGWAPVHVEGGTYVPGSGWYAVWDGNYTGRIRINWFLVVFDQGIQTVI